MQSTSDRQKAFRRAAREQRRRLDMWIDHRAMLALDRLARHQGLTRTAVLERLILDADDTTGRALDDAAFHQYLGVTG